MLLAGHVTTWHFTTYRCGRHRHGVCVSHARKAVKLTGYSVFVQIQKKENEQQVISSISCSMKVFLWVTLQPFAVQLRQVEQRNQETWRTWTGGGHSWCCVAASASLGAVGHP